MRLSDATVVIRPRSTWEAMDLGVLLSQRHRRLLISSWAMITLPVFALLSWGLWDSPSLAVFIFWWLKPAFERLPLYILSKAMFGETPTLRQALQQWPRLLKPQLLASLTWRRLSLYRSFVMPVVQLEGLDGAQRQQRLQVLLQREAGAARWLTIIGAHLEGVLWIGLMVLFYLLLPQQVALDWSWQSLISAARQDWRWLEHLTNAFYALVLVVWEPVYVACGFSLYLNRRTVLEAWDIELVFRRMRQRLVSTGTVLLVAVIALMPATHSVWAAEPANSLASPRLLNQPLTSQASRDSIKKILEQPPFKNRQTVTRFRLGDEKPGADAPTSPWWKALLKLFAGQDFAALATLIEVTLWSIVIASIGLLIWRYRDWLQAFVSRQPTLKVKTTPSLPRQAFGLDLKPESLPADIAARAESLWQTDPREALGLLYRALLSRLLHDFNIALKAADTEGQVLRRVESLQQPALLAYSKNLTGHWQNMAYGHRLPPEQVQQQLCDGWRVLFDAGTIR
ncbi:DUF4129 domain-containing protein [Pseudomonas sp. R37(2017)]|uniref:DUF4129 domain-containing protein n=1 Tax=Pseudomonas sp. R37(2017) TaxID=1981685 RepID=UPI000A1E2D96|nr:DUF4129 domain-containing protein [Pseudomonas sp. R37(2017)]